VLALGLSGADVVFASAATGERCPALTIWHTDLRFDRRFSTGRDCPATSTGSGIAAVAEAQGRVLWLSYAGGNNRDWTLYTASERARTPRLLRFVTVDVSAPPPIVVGDADERLLPYAVDRTVVALDPNGSRRFTWTAPSRVVGLAAGPASLNGLIGVVAQLDDGSVVTLSPAGAVLRTDTFAAGAVRGVHLGAIGTLIQLGDSLDIRKGASRRTLPLAPRAGQLDFAAGVAVYAAADGIHALRVATGADRVVARPAQPFLVRFSRRGLAWASEARVSFRAAAVFGAA